MFTRRFGSNPRKPMITNEIINRLGPGPAAYDNISALKKVISNNWQGPVIKRPTKLEDRSKTKLYASKSGDLLKQKFAIPGPGSYEPETSTFTISKIKEDSASKRTKNVGITIPKFSGERCIF